MHAVGQASHVDKQRLSRISPRGTGTPQSPCSRSWPPRACTRSFVDCPLLTACTGRNPGRPKASLRKLHQQDQAGYSWWPKHRNAQSRKERGQVTSFLPVSFAHDPCAHSERRINRSSTRCNSCRHVNMSMAAKSKPVLTSTMTGNSRLRASRPDLLIWFPPRQCNHDRGALNGRALLGESTVREPDVFAVRLAA
jgi:hypothetical protein